MCGISSLGIDHTSILGDTVEEIAWQKGGIFKVTGQPWGGEVHGRSGPGPPGSGKRGWGRVICVLTRDKVLGVRGASCVAVARALPLALVSPRGVPIGPTDRG